jgi:hypothetical protein
MRLAPDTRRFDVSPAWLCWSGAVPALETFADADLDAVRAHDVGLADSLLTALDLEPAGSAIVSLDDPDGVLVNRCGAAGLSVSGRGGRLRVGFHVWNDDDDVQRLLAVLKAAHTGRR